MSDEKIDEYIRDSEVVTIDIPENAIHKYEQFTPKLHRGNSYAYFETHSFYSDAYQKHFVLITFTYFEKNDQIRQNIIGSKILKTTARVNKKQQSSSEYGTEQKPIPIFPKDLLEGHEDAKEAFHLSEEMHHIYVQYYLNRFASKEDIKILFPE